MADALMRRLVDLAELDRSLRALREQLALYPKMTAEMDRQARQAEEGLEALKRRQKEALEARRQAELEVKALREKIAHYRGQQALVKTNKEYQAISEEIATVERKIDEADTRGLEALQVEETAGAQLSDAQARLGELRRKHEEERRRIDAQIAEKESRLRSGESERSDRLGGLDDQLREDYELLNGRYPGSAVAPVEDESCGGCRMNLVRQRTLDARRLDPAIRCDSCGRILYDPSVLASAETTS